MIRSLYSKVFFTRITTGLIVIFQFLVVLVEAQQAHIDGNKVNLKMGLRQHEVQAVEHPNGFIAIAWTDDANTSGLTGWRCGFSVSNDNGSTWTAPYYYQRKGYQLSGNPTVAVDSAGRIYATCMSVDEDYSKGSLDISISEDQGKTWHQWNNIISKSNGIPDRPKMLIDRKNNIHVIFTDVVRKSKGLGTLQTSIQLVRSTNGGKEWLSPQTLSTSRKGIKLFIDGYQGPSLKESPNGEILATWGAYYGKTIYFTRSVDQGESFSNAIEIPIRSVPMAFGVPCTELAIDHSGKNIVISVHEGHAIRPIYLFHSKDGGTSWKGLPKPTKTGTNMALAYDSTNRLHVIWTEYASLKMDVLWMVSADHGETFSEPKSVAGGGYLVKITNEDEFTLSLGSYQSYLLGNDGLSYAFLIDFRKGFQEPELYLTTWNLGK